MQEVFDEPQTHGQRGDAGLDVNYFSMLRLTGGKRDCQLHPNSNRLNPMYTGRGRPGRVLTGGRSDSHALPRNPTTVPGRLPPLFHY